MVTKSVDILRSYLLRKGIKADALAPVLGVRASYLYQTLKRGSEVGADRWREWCAKLGIDPATGEDLETKATLSRSNVPEGGRMYQNPATQKWEPYSIVETPALYEVGTILRIREVGRDLAVEVVEVRGCRTVIPSSASSSS